MSDNPNDLMLAEPDRHPGDITRCIKNVEKAELSPNVKVFMQAGGTYIWGHKNFRDNNAKIPTEATAFNMDENGKFVPVTGTVLTSGNISVRQWYLNKNEVIDIDEETGEFIRLYTPAENGKIGRYVYDKYHRDWKPREQLPISGEKNTETDMGSKEGLVSFLQAGQELEKQLYPEGNVRRALIFVNHGVMYSGGLYGVCNDEYTLNSLSLKEIQDAFAEVKGGWSNSEGKPFEVVAFDACVMGGYETALAVKDAANYMVASQEEAVGSVMLGYSGMLSDLSRNLSMSGAEFAKVISKTYWEHSRAVDKEFNMDTNSMLTSSVVDLSENKMETLQSAYADFSESALNVAKQNPDEFIQTLAKFNKAANAAEKYPSEAAATVFSVYDLPLLMDLKGFAKNTAQSFPELEQSGNALATAISNAVIYQRRGVGLNRGGGLSIFYPFNFLENNGQGIADYQKVAADDKLSSETQGQLYEFLYNGVTDNLQQVEVDVLDPKTGEPVVNPEIGQIFKENKWQIPEGGIFDLSALAEVEVQLNEDNKTVWVELAEEDRSRIEDVRSQVMLVDGVDEDGKFSGVYLGDDKSTEEDWQSGKFESTFNGQWLMLERAYSFKRSRFRFHKEK